MVYHTTRGRDQSSSRHATEIADELRGKPLDRALPDAFAEVIADGPVLDVGCGPGHATAYLTGRGVSAAGPDLSPGTCVFAHRATALPFAAADMTALPVRSRALAGILCLYAVIHLDTPRRVAAYAEFSRVLRPGGHAACRWPRSWTVRRIRTRSTPASVPTSLFGGT